MGRATFFEKLWNETLGLDLNNTLILSRSNNFMSYQTLVSMVIEKGVDNVALPESLRHPVLTEASRQLLNQHKYEEAGKALAKTGNQEALIKMADWFTKQALFWQAACFLVHTKDTDRINACALELINQDKVKEARHLYLATGNQAMLAFLRQNFDL